MATTRQNGMLMDVFRAIRAVLDFLWNLTAEVGVRIETLPQRYRLWLQRQRLTTEQFAGNLTTTLGVFGTYGLLIQLWAVGLGALVQQPDTFWPWFSGGLLLFGGVWVAVIWRCLIPINRIAGWIVLVLSAFGTLVVLGGSAIQNLTNPAGANLEMLTRGLIIFGYIVSVLGMLPFLVAKRLGSVLYALVFHGADVVSKAFKKLKPEEAQSVQAVLDEIRRLIAVRGGATVMERWFAVISIFTVVLFHFPYPGGIIAAAMVMAAAGALIFGVRRPFGLTGYMIPKVIYGGGIAAFIAELAYWGAYVFFGRIGYQPKWLEVALFVGAIVLWALLAALLIPHTRSGEEQEEIRTGHAPIVPFWMEATSVDPDTGKPKLAVRRKKERSSGSSGSGDSGSGDHGHSSVSGGGGAGGALWNLTMLLILLIVIGALWLYGMPLWTVGVITLFACLFLLRKQLRWFGAVAGIIMIVLGSQQVVQQNRAYFEEIRRQERAARGVVQAAVVPTRPEPPAKPMYPIDLTNHCNGQVNLFRVKVEDGREEEIFLGSNQTGKGWSSRVPAPVEDGTRILVRLVGTNLKVFDQEVHPRTNGVVWVQVSCPS